MNHYELLGVAADADQATVRRAYVAHARVAHPDFHVDAAPSVRAENAQRMQQLNEAWDTLGDAARRERYDLTLRGPSVPLTTRPGRRPEPETPAGKGWTPRPGDDAWQQDFTGWANETDGPEDDTSADGAARGVAAVAPVALFAIGGVLAFLGMLLSARPLVALAAGLFVISLALFVFLPMLSMTRRR